jgi:hypothetical protein
MRVVTLLFAIVFLLVPAPAKAGEDILRNAGFEDEERLACWMAGGSATFIWVEPWRQKEGKWAFGVGNDLDWAQDDAWGYCLQVLSDPKDPDKLYPVRAGDVIEFLIYAMGETGYKGAASLRLEFFDYDRRDGLFGPPLESFQSKMHMGSFEWSKITVSGPVPDGAVSAAVSCISDKMPKASKYVWFDDGRVNVLVGR